MKKASLILILLLSIFFALAGVSFAQEEELKSTKTILSEIRAEQGISDSQEIDVTKVSEAKLEELGDAVMEEMIGNTAVHEQMDIRLGGEGSESLKAFHMKLGLNYLRNYPDGMMNLMTGGMMTGNNSYAGSQWNGCGMMDDDNSYTASEQNVSDIIKSFVSAGIAIGFFLLVLVLIGLVIFAIFRSKGTTPDRETSFEILNRRYANGEIDEEEYNRKKAELRKP